jgi:hypothetical protein
MHGRAASTAASGAHLQLPVAPLEVLNQQLQLCQLRVRLGLGRAAARAAAAWGARAPRGALPPGRLGTAPALPPGRVRPGVHHLAETIVLALQGRELVHERERLWGLLVRLVLVLVLVGLCLRLLLLARHRRQLVLHGRQLVRVRL